MPRIFISYRRADSVTITGRIHDHLVMAFDAEHVFKDVDDIPLGADFRQILDHEVGSCEVLLVIVGTTWTAIQNEAGQPRLFDPDDFVRIEVAAGLRRSDVLVVPVLVKGAGMPSSADLPPDLQELAYRNAAIIRDDPDFSRDIHRLIEKIKEHEAALAAAPSMPAVEEPAVQEPAAEKPAQEAARAIQPETITPPPPKKPVSAAPPQSKSPEPTAPRKAHKRPWTLWIFAAIGVVMSVCCILVFGPPFLTGFIRGVSSDIASQQLVCGSEVAGTLDNETPVQEWPFAGQSGQDILLTTNSVDADSSLNPLIRLIAPWGETIAEDDNMGSHNNARLWTVLPDDGDYIALVENAEANASAAGSYTLRLECGIPKLNCGAPEYSAITNENPEQHWVFEGFEGQPIRLEMAHTETDDQGRYVIAHIILLGPNDEPLAESQGDVNAFLEYILPEDGLYALITTRADANNERQVGNYELTLLCE